MANVSFRRHTGVLFLIVCVLLVKVLQSQDVGESSEECDGCWGKLDEAVDTVARSIASYYRHRGKSEWRSEDDSAEQPEAYLPHTIFRRSTSSSTSIECESCWLVLRRFKSLPQENSHSKDMTNLRRLVKKTMLNNGWV